MLWGMLDNISALSDTLLPPTRSCERVGVTQCFAVICAQSSYSGSRLCNSIDHR